MDSFPVPLWSLGVLLIIVGPFAVQRLVDLWASVVERRTDEALSAMTARTKGTSVNVHDGDGDAAVTRQDASGTSEPRDSDSGDREDDA